jgi:hypothetical protein
MFVALVIQYAKRMRRIILTSVAYMTLPYFSTLSHKRHGIRKKLIEHKMCFFLQNLSERLFTLRRIWRDIVINVHRFSCKLPVTLVKLEFLDGVSKNTQMSYLMKILPHAARCSAQTERHDDANVCVPEFCEHM